VALPGSMGPLIAQDVAADMAESMDVDSDQTGEHSGGFLPDGEDDALASPSLSPGDEARRIAEAETEAVPADGVKQYLIDGRCEE
jgi:hypothetical protein